MDHHRQQHAATATEKMLCAAVGQAMQQLPSDATLAYVEASVHAPELVQLESGPLLFLRNARGNIQEAALKLGKFWSLRRDFFGPQRAFLPMNRTGRGALTRQDIDALEESCLRPLPHQAFYVDLSKISSSTTDQGLRCLFYQLQSSTNNSLPSQEGMVQLLMVTEQTQATNLETFVNLMSILLEAIPLRLKRLHILTPSPTTESSSAIISFMMRLIMLKELSEEAVVTVFVSRQDLVQKLAFYGLREDSLPPELGGGYNRATARAARSPDHSLSTSTASIPAAAVATTTTAPDFGIPVGGALVGAGELLQPQTTTTGTERMPLEFQENEHLQRPQRFTPPTTSLPQAQFANASLLPGRWEDERAMPRHFVQPQDHHARVVAVGAALPLGFDGRFGSQEDDRKLPATAMGGPRQMLRETQASAGSQPSTGKRSAESTSPGEEDDEEDDDQDEEAKRKRDIRKRNALYSRRSYQKTKIELQVLETQHRQLTSQNEELQREQQRLEQLVKESEQCVKEHEATTTTTTTQQMPPGVQQEQDSLEPSLAQYLRHEQQAQPRSAPAPSSRSSSPNANRTSGTRSLRGGEEESEREPNEEGTASGIKDAPSSSKHPAEDSGLT